MSAPESDVPSRPRPWQHPAAWVSTTYFAEGFPYSVVHVIAETLFAEMGASLRAIGMTSLLHLPWNLKFLWAPFLDSHATKRAWLLGTQGLIAALLLGLLLTTASTPSLAAATVLFAFLAVVAATHDVAIDGYYLEALPASEQAKWVALRAPAYRAALLLVGGPGLYAAAHIGWSGLFAVCAGLFGLLVLFHAQGLPKVEAAGRPARELFGTRGGAILLAAIAAGCGVVYGFRPEPSAAIRAWTGEFAPALLTIYDALGISGLIACGLGAGLLGLAACAPLLKRNLERSKSPYAHAFTSFLTKPRVGLILIFTMTFRTGESFLEKMRYPFFKELGLGLEAYGAARTAGLVAALAAPAIGGWLIARQGLRRWIWPFVIAQNGLNLLYWWLALQTAPSPELMVGVITLEMFGAGLGTAVFMVYLMRCPLPGHKAAHFAILTALMSVSFTVAGLVSGFLAEGLGFANYFLLTVAAAVPGMLVIPFLPHLDEPED